VNAPVVELKDVSVRYGNAERPVRAVDQLNLSIEPGQIVGLVGESGSGKTTLCSVVMRSLPPVARLGGTVNFEGRDLYSFSAKELRKLRLADMTMILQNPMTALDPLYTIGDQLGELLSARGSSGVGAASLAALKRVHLTAAEMRMQQYPHELSGGMKQRVLIAMATSSRPKLLIADEPTSALDASIQDEILLLLREARDRDGTAVLIVSHDLGAIRRVSDRTVVMYAGRIVEDGPTQEVFRKPRHPYTKALLDSLPRFEGETVTIQSIEGQVPRLDSLPSGCAFAERCGYADAQCRAAPPPDRGTADHRTFCWQTI
jgi:peptide/nickel transport system ATP-binding protein